MIQNVVLWRNILSELHWRDCT